MSGKVTRRDETRRAQAARLRASTAAAAAGLVVHCQGAAGSLSSAQLGTQDIGMLAELEDHDHDHFDMAKGIFGYGASWTFLSFLWGSATAWPPFGSVPAPVLFSSF